MSSNSAADDLKNQGNTYFKAGDFAKASKCYAEAEKLCPTIPVFPSNLSAALFEEGDYLSCILAVDRWWRLYRPSNFEENPLGPDSRVSLRLAGRLAKALGHGVRNGTLSPQRIRDLRVTIAELRLVSLPSLVAGASLHWDIIDEVDGREEQAAEARARFSALPIFRKPVKPYMTYFTIGQDPLMSLVDGWGPDHEAPLDVESIFKDGNPRLSFLLGGVGDARHVYSTLVGLHRFHRKLSKRRQSALRVHVTLLDIHPAVLARDLCMLLLLNQVMDTPAKSTETRAEIFSTMFYTFAGTVMPGYCYSRLEAVMKELRSTLQDDVSKLPSWIHVDSAAKSKIDSTLQQWLTVPQKWTAKKVLSLFKVTSPADVLKVLNNPGVSPAYRATIEARVSSRRQQIIEMMKQLTPEQLREMNLVPPPKNASTQVKKDFHDQREKFIDLMLENVLNDDGNMIMERLWYEKVKVFVPPRELWSRHVGMKNFELLDQCRVEEGGFDAVKEHINSTWKPNSTLFDSTNPPNFENLNSFEAPGHINTFNHEMGINSTSKYDKPAAPAYGNCVDLFAKAAEALCALKSQIKFELLCGELTQELSKMRLGGDRTRPASFPRTYQRAHLSNIPDYTHGTLNKIIYALPVVEEASSNCFLNTGIWADNEEFVHTYTLLTSADIPKYLGCRFISKDAMHGLVILRKQDQRLPLSKLASRSELITWLTRILLNTVLPTSVRQGQFRARLPNNLVAFVALLMHLASLGYPGHWLGEFLQTVLSGRLLTDIAPYTGKLPIPVSDINRRVKERVVRLDPWVVELGTILVTALHGIPFYVALPKEFQTLSHTDIGTFEAKVEFSGPWMGFMMGTLMPVEDPVVCLLFYKSSIGLRPDELIAKLPEILGGAGSPELCGSLFVLTSQEVVDVPTIRWRLSKTRVSRMKEEGWAMVAYRTDEALSFTTPVSAIKWRDVAVV